MNSTSFSVQRRWQIPIRKQARFQNLIGTERLVGQTNSLPTATRDSTARRPGDQGMFFPRHFRGTSIDRNPLGNIQQNFQALQVSYKKMLQQNNQLKSKRKLRDEHSLSTVILGEKDQEFGRLSQSEEIESLYQKVSESHQSLRSLIQNFGVLQHEKEELNKKVLHQKYLEDMDIQRRSVKIKLVIFIQLEETLSKKNQETQQVAKSSKKIQIDVFENEKEVMRLRKQIKGIESKLKEAELLAGKEGLGLADTYYKLAMSNFALEDSEKKILKLEKFIQSMKTAN